MTKNIEICKAEEVGAQVLDIRTTAERQTVAAINAAFGLAIPLPANEPGKITELPAAVSAHDRQLLAQLLGKPEPAATLSTTDPLATFVATLTRELYRHFAERQAVYPLADFPAWFPHDDRNLAHLLQAVQSLSPRKISNGSATNDGLPDGVSLGHLLSDTTLRNAVTEIKDENSWDAITSNTVFDLFPNINKATLGFKAYSRASGTGGSYAIVNRKDNLEELYCPNMTSLSIIPNDSGLVRDCNNLKIVECPNLSNIASGFVNTAMFWGSQPELRRLQVGKITGAQDIFCGNTGAGSRPKLIDLEIGAGTAVNLSSLQYWSPSYVLSDNPTGNDLVPSGSTCQTNLEQFLVNFKTHIALRLTSNGSGLTLTLSQAVRNAIHAAESTYGIEDIIVNQKHWTLSPAPSA